METQYLYNQNDIRINDIQRFVICYKVSYSQSNNFKKNSIKCINIEYTKDDRKKYGNTIPNNVKIIGEKCFERKKSKSIEVPSLVTSLKKSCFFCCDSLSKIKLPFGLKTIPNRCFFGCISLKTIEIPQQVSVLKTFYFGSCFQLETIEIPNSVQNIEFDCFYNCTSLKSIKLSTNINKLSDYLFQTCLSLSYIDIPTNVAAIKNYCFKNCYSLTSIIIPTTVTSIGINCFTGCSKLKNIEWKSYENKQYHQKVSYNDYVLLKEININCTNVIFNRNDSFQFKTIPNDIPLIIDKYIKQLEEIRISTNIISMKSNYLSKNITTINIPSSVTKLGDDIFKDYDKLQSITIPTTIQSFGKHIIDGCISLTNIEYDGDWNNIIVSYNDYLRYNRNGLIFKSIEYTNDDRIKYGDKLPTIIKSIDKSYINQNITTFTISTTIEYLNNQLFMNCSRLTSINISSTITSIPNKCFKNCISLESITIPTTITTFGKQSFMNCQSLQSINIPTSILYIDKQCFKKCYSLTSLNIPNSIKMISSNCFDKCYSLQSISLPSTIKLLQSCCFTKCTNLTSIKIPNDNITYEEHCFEGYDQLKNIINALSNSW